MPVIIREITSEVALAAEETHEATPAGAPAGDADAVERVVRQAVRRVLEILRREEEH